MTILDEPPESALQAPLVGHESDQWEQVVALLRSDVPQSPAPLRCRWVHDGDHLIMVWMDTGL